MAEESVLYRNFYGESVISGLYIRDGNLGVKAAVVIGGRIIAAAESYENLVDLSLFSTYPAFDFYTAGVGFRNRQHFFMFEFRVVDGADCIFEWMFFAPPYICEWTDHGVDGNNMAAEYPERRMRYRYGKEVRAIVVDP